MKNKSQSKSFSLFLFPLVIFFFKQMCFTFSQSLGSSFSSVNLFPILSFNRVPPTPCGPHFWNLRAPFPSNILSRPVILETKSLVVFFRKHYMHTGLTGPERKQPFACCQCHMLRVGTNTIMGERQPSESTLQLASRLWRGPQSNCVSSV